MMKAWILVLPFLALLAGCAPFSVRYDYDARASFAGYRTWAWAPEGERPKAKVPNDPIMDRRVHRLVDQALGARGFQPAQGAPADFLVAYRPVYQDRVVQTYTEMGPAWGYGWGRPWGYGSAIEEVQRFREGTIVLEILDARSGQVVWQAAAEGALNGLDSPQDAEEQVGEAVRKMLEHFPPPVK